MLTQHPSHPRNEPSTRLETLGPTDEYLFTESMVARAVSTGHQKCFMQTAWTGAGTQSAPCSTLRATHGWWHQCHHCPAHPHWDWSRGWPLGSSGSSVCAVPSPPGPWHALETHHHPQSSLSLGLCKLIVQSHLSGNSLCESSQESGLYLSQ